MYTKIHFRPYNPKQILLFPSRLDKDIAENDPVRVIDAVIDELKLGLIGQNCPDFMYYFDQ